MVLCGGWMKKSQKPAITMRSPQATIRHLKSMTAPVKQAQMTVGQKTLEGW
jgi:hypothetical protein